MRLVSLILLCLSLSACATLSGEKAAEPDYAATAEENLRKGQEALQNNNYEEASAYFEHVRTAYPFLAAATLAELRLADVDFARDEFISARDRYQAFIKLHPTSPEVDYAGWRAALTHYREIPGDFFLVPSSREKDQTPVLAAQRALQDFLKTYPDSKYVPEAQKTLADVRKRLAEHELYVAGYYARRGRWEAVANRLNTVLERYPDTGYQEQALFDLHDAYVRLGQQDKARQTLERIQQALPGTPAAERARKLMGS